jgi:hypothetical protein
LIALSKSSNRYVFDTVQIQSVGAIVNTEIFAQVSKFGMTVKEVPVSHFPRQPGKSTGGNLAVIKAFRELIRIRRKVDRIAAVIVEFVDFKRGGRVATNQSSLRLFP